MQSPDIDVHYDMNVNVEKQSDGNQRLTISGTITGDGFPAAELFADIGGARVFMAAAPAQHGPNYGPFVALWGDSQKQMARFKNTFVLDKNDKFVGAIKDGKMLSAQEWNKSFENTSPVPKE